MNTKKTVRRLVFAAIVALGLVAHAEVTVTSTSDGATCLLTFGKIMTEDLKIKLCKGATPTGNPFVLPVKLSDITITGENMPDYDGGIQLRILDGAGRVVESYDYRVSGEWVKSGDTEYDVSNTMFKPGQGFMVIGTSDSGQYMTIPAPSLD